MSTKTPHAVRGRKRANEPHLEDPGNIGRATGLEMPRFSKGSDEFDSLSEYFPQTDRTTRGQRKSDHTLTSSEDMDVEESSGLEVTEHLQQRSAKSTHKPPPPSRSPLKSNVRGTPKRLSSAGAPSSAGTIATAPRSTSHAPGSVPKLDLTIGRSPRRSYTPRVNGASRSSNIFSISPSPEIGRRAAEPLRDDETEIEQSAQQEDAFMDQSDLAAPSYENDTLGDMQPNDTLDDSLAPTQESTSKGKGKMKLQASPRTSGARRSVQSEDLESAANGDPAQVPMMGDDVHQISEHEEAEPEAQLEEDASAQATSPPRKKRGRPPKNKTAELPNSKKPRHKPPAPDIEKEDKKETKKQDSKQERVPKEKQNKRVVSRASSEPSGTKSNVRERHETPFEEDETKKTRSGRLTYKPLAHWKNERINFQPTETADGAVVYNIADLVRMEDVTPKKRIYNRSDEPTTVRRRRRPKTTTIFEDDPEDKEEDWEASSGVMSGAVRMWDPDLEASPEETRNQELAFAGSKIETRDNAEGSFRFAKTLTLPFFGSGIVELPPGGIKRTKNSRRMQMVFFVFIGKVTVEVAGTRFAITKGGVWQVPRGNLYSIENETEHLAKLFFAQGCEVEGGTPAEGDQDGEVPAQ